MNMPNYKTYESVSTAEAITRVKQASGALVPLTCKQLEVLTMIYGEREIQETLVFLRGMYSHWVF